MSPRWGLGLGVSFFYTDVAPLGLNGGGHRDATQMSPRWGYEGVGIAMLHRCRPAGAWVWGVPLFYTDVAPLGLNGGGHRDATQMSPRWGLGLGWASHNYTYIAPLGLRRGGHRDATYISPRWGNQSSVCSRAIYRTFFLGERHTECAYYLASRAQFAPTEEQQLAVRSRDSEIPPTGRAVSS